MNTKKRTIIGILAMIIVLAVSAGCLFGCGKSDDEDEKEKDKKQTQKADDEDEDDEDDDEDEDEDEDKKPSKKGKKDDDEDEDEDGYEAVVKKYMDAYKKGDAKKIVALMPEKLLEKSIEVEYDGDEDAMLQEKQDAFDRAVEGAKKNGYKWSKLKYEIEDVEDMDEDEIEELIEDIEDDYDLKLKIKEAKTVEISITIPAEDEDEDDDEKTLEITLVKIGSSWYTILD